MVKVTIDNREIEVEKGCTIMEAADRAGIPIPRLCYLKEINEIGACRVCVVEIEGKEKLVASCNNQVEEGMVVYTNSSKVRRNRRKTIEMILSQHNADCVTCTRNRNCSLQTIARDLNILDVPYEKNLRPLPWNKNFPLIRDNDKCIKCMRCIQVCDKIQDMGVWEIEGTGSRTDVYVSGNRTIEESDCTLCGQCVTHCPVGALRERDDTEKVWWAIDNREKVTVVQVAPAVRTAWGEAFGMTPEETPMGKIVDALKRMGFDYVFDTVFSADLTIMEEGNEFLERFKRGDTRQMPMFTSCCPGWVRFLKSQYPHLTDRLSTAKSPQQMFGAVMKTYFAKQIGVPPENIVTVSIMPCMAKKAERRMELFYEEYAGNDVDVVLTTRELNRMIKMAHIDPHTLEEKPCDRPMGEGTGAGVIFGTTGGVMEAALRSAFYLATGSNPAEDAFEAVRSSREEKLWKEALFQIQDFTVRTAVVNGLGNTRKLIEALERGEAHYDFVEVMACPGGCVGGGGQPIRDGVELAAKRSENLRNLDSRAKRRFSHENPDVIKLYEEFLEKPLSHQSHLLLHTDHHAWEMPRPQVKK
ncbi:MAG: [FeFe] hydrogenase, group A [Clostridiales bacterium]|nr:[FeFe] hydrogenase, group A [Clostridiales bacterium]